MGKVFNFSAGHGAQDSKSCGAYEKGLLYESVENRPITDKCIEIGKARGHAMRNNTVNYPASKADCINKVVKDCNSVIADMNVQIHFNDGRNNPSGDGKIGGVECWVYDDRGTSYPAAKRICEEMAKLGFTNRGVKFEKNKYGFLRDTKAQAIIVEVCFVDDKDDYILYHKVKEDIPYAIMSGLLNEDIKRTSSDKVSQETRNIKIDGKVLPCEVLMKNDRTYVKLRDFEKAGYRVDWVNNMATIDRPQK